MCASGKKQCSVTHQNLPFYPNTGLTTALSDCTGAHQVVLKVQNTVDSSVILTLPAAGVGENKKTNPQLMAEGLELDVL